MLKNLMIAALLLLPAPVLAAPSESAFDRVMRTNTLRCGYWNWAPLFSVDTATEQQSGIFYDLMAYIGPAMGLKVEWTKEVTGQGPGVVWSRLALSTTALCG